MECQIKVADMQNSRHPSVCKQSLIRSNEPESWSYSLSYRQPKERIWFLNPGNISLDYTVFENVALNNLPSKPTWCSG